MIDLDQLPMRVGLGQFQEITPTRLQFIKQCGCDDFQLNTPALPGRERWEYEDLARLGSQAGEILILPALSSRQGRSVELKVVAAALLDELQACRRDFLKLAEADAHRKLVEVDHGFSQAKVRDRMLSERSDPGSEFPPVLR